MSLSHRIHRKPPTPVIVLSLLLPVIGCDVQRIAGMTGGETKLSGPHSAIGGLNYQGAAAAGGDWHITSCSQPAPRSFTFGAGSQAGLLTLQAATPAHLIVHPGESSQPIQFSAADCTVLKLDLTPRSDRQGESDGKLSIVCRRGSETLNGSVRFERCGP